MTDDDARQKILERRSYFIRAALAGAGIGAAGLTACDPLPQPCLEPPLASGQPSAEASPSACLKVALPEDANSQDAGAADASTKAAPAPSASSGSGTATAQSASAPRASATAAPNPTQTKAPPTATKAPTPPPPRPCLKMVRPPSGSDTF